MRYIKQIYDRLNLKLILIILMVLASLLLQLISNSFVEKLSPQRIVDRWDSREKFAQISVFYKNGYEPDSQMVMQYEARLYESMKEASVDLEANKGRSLVNAYSTESKITVKSEKSELTARALGVSKDFFLFHPVKLLSGNYLSKSDENADGILLDENTAWTLFGARDVAGMYVDISGRACVIRGVVKCDEGMFSEAAEEQTPTVYMDFDLLSKLNGGESTEEEVVSTPLGISCYELLIQNPVKDFGKDRLKEIMGLEDGTYEIVENSSRFTVVNRLKRIAQIGKRSMNLNGVTYPYWENRARAYEDVTTLMIFIQLLLLIYPLFVVLKIIFSWLKNKKYKILIESTKNMLVKLYLDKYKTRKK